MIFLMFCFIIISGKSSKARDKITAGLRIQVVTYKARPTACDK